MDGFFDLNSAAGPYDAIVPLYICLLVVWACLTLLWKGANRKWFRQYRTGLTHALGNLVALKMAVTAFTLGFWSYCSEWGCRIQT